MRKIVTIILSLIIGINAQSQISTNENPYSFKNETFNHQTIKTLKLEQPDLSEVIAEDIENDKETKMMRFGVIIPIYKDFFQEAQKTQVSEGEIWTLSIEVPEAQALVFYSDDFQLPRTGKLFLYNEDKTKVLGAFTHRNNCSDNTFATEYLEGDKITIEYFQPYNETQQPQIELTEIGYAYRGITKLTDEYRSSGDCNVNVNCSEGDNFRNEQRGVCRIQVRMSSYYMGWCTGTLVNNTNYDYSPYILTAAHCVEDVESNSYYSQFVFYFKYENSGCSTTGAEPSRSKSITGGTLKALDNSYANNGSDFALFLLNDDIPQSYDPFWCGWDKRNRTVSNGVGIHHPSGDVKKISTFETQIQGASYGADVATHWMVDWAETENGWGIMEGGSSGSALFNSDGLIIGTLTGGASSCDVPTEYKYDLYGKLSYSWQSNGNSNSRKLKPWLDPAETNANIVYGMDYNSSLSDLNAEDETIKVYPNPTKDQITISITKPTTDLTIEIYDQTGRKLHNQTIDNNQTISLSHLTKGVYTLKIITDNNTCSQQIILCE